MIGLDTNVLVRYFTQDDPAQSKRATLFIESHCTEDNTGFVSLVVLCELVWVLDAGYGYAKADIARLLRGIASAPALTLENHERVARALSLYEKCGAGFSDCLIACSCEDEAAVPVFTFDKAAARVSNLFKTVP
jgi:predicted nucleic-acid-binding protein